jgi:hypothetical protein
MMAKLFYLQRTQDESGISGTGRIAQGIIFDNGKVALTWLSDTPCTGVYDSIGDVRSIHGHEGKTEVIMEQDWKRSFNELKSALAQFDPMTVIKDKLPEGSDTKDLIEKHKEK